MNILLVSATQPEIQRTIDAFKLQKNQFENEVFSGKTDKFNLTVLVTGIGMVNTAFELGKIGLQSFDVMINVGICGSYNRNIPLGSVIEVREEVFADVGATESDGTFIGLESLGFALIKQNDQAYYNKLTNSHQLDRYFTISPPAQCVGLTVNTVTGDDEQISRKSRLFHPDAESMEGAAVALCAIKSDKPWFEFRSVSNYVEPRNRANWKISEAIKSLNQFLTSQLLPSVRV